MRLYVVFGLQVLALVSADVYLHNPRGSNNRLDGGGRNRGNANRLFDSQNNNRGGYNVGSLYYYQGSVVPIEWTNQHSCGDQNNNCEIVIQYMCGPLVRDGTSRGTIPDHPLRCNKQNCNTDLRFGMHEDYNYYKKCIFRRRNKGLFTADQRLRGQTARFTRQNPNGVRRGYECPEERDYYPYWKANPWKDIVVFTGDTSRCDYYQNESYNVKDRYECEVPAKYKEFAYRRRLPIPDTKKECERVLWPLHIDGVKGKWVKVKSHGIPPPECLQAPWSRDNHNGNGVGGYPNTYNWTVPNIQEENCVLRIRYNISTNDYDPLTTDASKNGYPVTGVDIGTKYMLGNNARERGYVFKNDPEVQPLAGPLGAKLKLKLAINTAQFGRTFQDRSHTFAIRARPDSLKGKQIINVNVRGKRGNIVQVYPAVEYDFVPNVLTVGKDDYIHFQWTGSNSNPGNNAGQGRAGSDRSNVVLLASQFYPEGTPLRANPHGKYGHWGRNYPARYPDMKFLGLSKLDLTRLAYVEPGLFNGNANQLDDAGTYFDLGPRKATRVGTYHYFSTRNNAFTNRSQKGKIVVMHIQVVGKTIGWSGGHIVFQDGKQGIWVDKNTLDGTKYILLREWSQKEGDWYIKYKKGTLEGGKAYASQFLTIDPFEKLTQDGKHITVKMKVEKVSGVKVYYSKDAITWVEVPAEVKDGIATFKTSSGGIFVARKP